MLDHYTELGADERMMELLNSHSGLERTRLAQLASSGMEVGADTISIVLSMDEYLKEPEDWNFAHQQKVLVCEALDLPKQAVNSPFTLGGLMEFAAELQFAGSGFEVLQDPETWKLIKLRGRGAAIEKDRIVTEVLGRNMGVPDDVMIQVSREQFFAALEGVQRRGLDFAITDPEFWSHFLSSPDKEEAYKWARSEEASREKQSDADLKRKIAEINRASAERESERRELENLRENERQKKIAEKVRRRRRRRRRRRSQVSTIPSEIRIATTRQVATPWGTNYLLRVYEDGTSEMFRINDDGSLKTVLKLAHHAYNVSETPGGMLYVIPVIGRRTSRRPSSPLDRTEGQRRGPVGIDQ